MRNTTGNSKIDDFISRLISYTSNGLDESAKIEGGHLSPGKERLIAKDLLLQAKNDEYNDGLTEQEKERATTIAYAKIFGTKPTSYEGLFRVCFSDKPPKVPSAPKEPKAPRMPKFKIPEPEVIDEELVSDSYRGRKIGFRRKKSSATGENVIVALSAGTNSYGAPTTHMISANTRADALEMIKSIIDDEFKDFDEEEKPAQEPVMQYRQTFAERSKQYSKEARKAYFHKEK